MQYYNSIDNIPCSIFDEILKTNKFELLKIDRFADINCEDVWNKIYDEFIDEFGISDKMQQYLLLSAQLVNHYNNIYNHGEKHEINFVNLIQKEIDDLLSGQEVKTNMYASISKFMGFPVRAKDTTVKEFYSYLNLANEFNRQNSAINNKAKQTD